MSKIIRCSSYLGNGSVEVPATQLVFRPSVYAIIHHHGQLVMVRDNSHGKLFFPGGGVDPGERMIDALHREVWGKTELRIARLQLWRQYENFVYHEPDQATWHCLLFFFKAEIVGSSMKLSARDPAEGRPEWLSLESYNQHDLQGIAPQVIGEYRSSKQSGQ